MAGSPRTACPLARPYGGASVSDDARRARSGAPGQQSDQQSTEESACALSTLPHAARSAAPFGTALDHLPPAFGSRRSLPWSVPGTDRRADTETNVARVAILRGRRIGRRHLPTIAEQTSQSSVELQTVKTSVQRNPWGRDRRRHDQTCVTRSVFRASNRVILRT